jgi:hypothetical protein
MMAKVTITIEDRPDGRVSIKAQPNFETLMQKDMSGATWTSAEGMAVFILNRVFQHSKQKAPSKIWIPGIKV